MNAQLDKDLPIPSEAELKSLAEKTYLTLQDWRESSGAYASGNPDIPHMIEGYFRGKAWPYIRSETPRFVPQDIKVVDGNRDGNC